MRMGGIGCWAGARAGPVALHRPGRISALREAGVGQSAGLGSILTDSARWRESRAWGWLDAEEDSSCEDPSWTMKFLKAAC